MIERTVWPPPRPVINAFAPSLGHKLALVKIGAYSCSFVLRIHYDECLIESNTILSRCLSFDDSVSHKISLKRFYRLISEGKEQVAAGALIGFDFSTLIGSRGGLILGGVLGFVWWHIIPQPGALHSCSARTPSATLWPLRNRMNVCLL